MQAAAGTLTEQLQAVDRQLESVRQELHGLEAEWAGVAPPLSVQERVAELGRQLLSLEEESSNLLLRQGA
jgi:hypothetical protein